MEKNTKKISIGIPAYNEEGNIYQLLISLLSQEECGFTLSEILVVSDQSTDSTVSKVKQISDPRVRLIENKSRVGMAFNQNKIFEQATGDIIVLLNADVKPAGTKFLYNIIQPFYSKKNLGLVGGKVTPLDSKTFVEKVINYSVGFKQWIFERINNGNNVYLCHGRVRAFSRELAESLRWPFILSEDAFSYFFCIQAGFDFFYQPESEVFYRSPQSLKDHLKQNTRFLQSTDNFENYFDKNVLRSSYRIPKSLIIISSLKGIFTHFILFSAYLYFIFLSIFEIKFNKASNLNPRWNPSSTTKQLE